MMIRAAVLGLAAVLAGLAGPLVTTSPAQSVEDPAALVRQLGDDAYTARRAAAEKLSAMGLSAREALLAGLKDADPEIRRRCRWILEAVLENDWNQRVADFESDFSDERDHDIPCWNRYKQLVGNDENARKLFLAMLKAEAGLLETATSGELAECLDLRIRQIVQPMFDGSTGAHKPASLGSVATILFLCGDSQIKLPQGVREHNFLMSVIQQGEFINALNQGPFQPAAKKLLGLWVLAPATINMQYNKLQLAMQYGLEDGVELAVKLCQDSQSPPHFRQLAISSIGMLGNKSHAAALTRLLEDKTVVFNGGLVRPGNKRANVEVRDLALAWLIFLTDQDHADYGMPLAKKEFEEVKKNRRRQPNFTTMGFAEAENRDAALAKWKAWVGEHPLPKLPEKAKVEIQTVVPEAQPIPPAALFAGPGAPQRAGATESEKESLDGMTLEPADRAEIKRLSTARELCANGQYGEAARILDEILSAEEDRAFRPTLKMPLYRCLKPEAERMVGAMPKQGREAYRLHFEVAARTALAQAAARGDIDAVAAVATRYFHTQSGAEAAYLVAEHLADAGEPLRAALHFERIRRQSHDADRLEPALSLNLAACALKAGMIREANAAAASLKPRAEGGKVRVAGKPVPLFAETGKAIDWLESLVGQTRCGALVEGWLMYRGSPLRSSECRAAAPSIQPQMLSPMSSTAALASAIDDFCKENAQTQRVCLPRLHPLSVGRTILMRSAASLKALDAASGELLWETELEDSLRAILAGDGAKDIKAFRADPTARSLRQRLWEDLTYGTMSADGGAVYGVEDVVFLAGEDNRRMRTAPDGSRRLDSETLRGHNLLTAHDLRTGKLKWEIGGAKGAAALPLAGACFLGPPLPLGGRLYAVAQIEKETRLLELDAESGRLIGALTLLLQDDSPNEMAIVMPLAQSQSLDAAARRAGASPSYGEGTLVCQIGESQFVAIDLATRTVRWVYQTPENDTNRRGMFGVNAWQNKAREVIAAERSDRWMDGSAVICDGRVLLTPADSNELICLSLSDGCLLWTAPRRDGLFVGGAADGTAIVVGRGNVWGLRLADGSPAWKTPSAKLPTGALPSGSGVVAQGRFYLPLSTGEIAAVDLAQGKIVARSRTADGLVPGNLAACGETLLAQNAQGLWRFDSLSSLDAQTAAALAANKDDPEALSRRGDALLAAGRIAEAVDLLARAAQRKTDAALDRRLGDALLDGLSADFAAFEPKADTLEPLIARSGRLADVLRRKIEGLVAAGRGADAFRACLKLADLPEPAEGAEPKLLEIATGYSVRPERWTAARLAEIRAGADAALAKAIDREVSDRLNDDRGQRLVDFFPWHPKVNEARLRLAKAAAEKGQLRVAEQWLRDVLDSDRQDLHGEAAARLADVLVRAKQPFDAAEVYAVLGSDFAAVVCLDGKTGRELAATPAAQEAIRAAQAAAPQWPSGKPKADFDENAKNNAGFFRFPVLTAAAPGRYNAAWRTQVDSRNRHIVLSDASGRTRCDIDASSENSPFFGNPGFNASQLCVRGRFVLAWLGNRVRAFDAMGEKPSPLWDISTFTVKMPPQFAGIPVRMRQPQQIPPLPGADLLPIVFAGGAVALIQDHSLLLLDGQTGKPLWKREDVPFESSLVGDGEVLLVTRRDAAEAVAYSALDGRELGSCPIPATADRLWTLGRRVAAWKPSEQGMCLSLVDPWTRQTVYTRTFAPKAQICLIDGEEAGVFDGSGHFNVIDLATGAERLAAAVEPVSAIERILVQRSQTQYVLLASGPPVQGNMVIFNGMTNEMRVNGKAYAFDRTSGKHRWTVDLESQSFRTDQQPDVPALVFYGLSQRFDNNRVFHRQKLLCVDKRTGKLLVERETENHAGNACEIAADAKAGTIDVRTMMGTAKIRYAPAEKDK